MVARAYSGRVLRPGTLVRLTAEACARHGLREGLSAIVLSTHQRDKVMVRPEGRLDAVEVDGRECWILAE